MADQPIRRSRFDQTGDNEPTTKSRFDRRSRSPAARDNESRRSRSPMKGPDSADGDARKSAAQAAAEAAAKINASLSHRKPSQPTDSAPPNRALTTNQTPGSPSNPPALVEEEIYQQDGDFIKDIEVNDLRNRYTLTKGSTQKMIKEETGADVTTRGNYYPDKAMATPAAPPLYLHVTSTTREGLENAVKKIEDLMKQDLPNLVDERRFRRREQPERPEVDSMGRRKWPEERIPVDLEPIPGFNLRAQVVGTAGANVKHIQGETRCRVQIKGRGSGFMESDTGRESDEHMYLHVTGPIPAELARAKELCESLLGSVRESYEAFKERGPPQRNGGHGGGFNDDRGSYHRGDRQNSGSYGGNGSAYGGSYGNPNYGGTAVTQSPSVAVPDANGAEQQQQQQQYEAWAQYYAANPSQDPYAAYGGYATMMASYMQQQQQQQPYAQAGAQPQYGFGQSPPAGGMGVPPPPPPPEDDVPPPPPPPPGTSHGSGGFSSVSPMERVTRQYVGNEVRRP